MTIIDQQYSPAGVADAGEGGGNEGEVVHLLQTDHVRLVDDDLLQDPPPPAGPVQGPGVRQLKLVNFSSDGCKYLAVYSVRSLVITLGQYVPLEDSDCVQICVQL